MLTTPRAPSLPLLYTLAGLTLVVACLYWAKTVLIPIALAILFTFLLNPVVRVLQRRGLPRLIAVLLVVIFVFSVVGGVAWTVARQLTMLADDLPHYQENIRRKITDLRTLGEGGVIERVQTSISELVREMERVRPPAPEFQPPEEPTATPEKIPEEPVPVVVQAPPLWWQLPSVLEPLATAGLVIVLVIFMLVKYSDLRARMIRLAGYGRLTLATKALDDAGQRISRYLLRQATVNGSFGFVVGVGLFLIGVPYAILWGFLASLLQFIPYVGPALAILLPSAMSLAVFPGWEQPLLVMGLILLLVLANSMILEPLLYGQTVGVSPVALLVAIAFWTWLWGPIGLLLATPLTVCLGVLGRYIPQLEFIGVLLSDEPVMESPTNYYQRLVARDQDEATALVEEYLETHAPESVYDEVLIPALNAAKRDRELGTLTDEDVQFIIRTTRAIVEDIGMRLAQPVPSAVIAPTDISATGFSQHASDAGAPSPRILGCPAEDEADELALLMLRQLLDPARYTLEIVSADVLTSEVLSVVEQRHPGVICIATLPPSALAPSRYLCKRLRARFPECKIVVGRWGLREDWDRPQALLREAGADEVGMTLQETANQVIQLSQLMPSCEPPSSPPPTSDGSLPEDEAARL